MFVAVDCSKCQPSVFLYIFVNSRQLLNLICCNYSNVKNKLLERISVLNM